MAGTQVDGIETFLKHLQQRLPHFEDRPSQRRFMELWARAIESGASVAIEAPTGSGKSFAYAIPLLLSGEPAIIATHTISLQNQLLSKDLPTLAQITPFKYTIAKGFNNFLCNLKGEAFEAETRETAVTVGEWITGTQTGDKEDFLEFAAEALSAPGRARIWGRIAAHPDDCLRKRCRLLDECFYFRHRREWAEAQLIVANHHLVLLNALTGSALLPEVSLLVIDEADALEEAARQVLTRTASSAGARHWLQQLARENPNRSRAEARYEGLLADQLAASRSIVEKADAIEGAWREALETAEERMVKTLGESVEPDQPPLVRLTPDNIAPLSSPFRFIARLTADAAKVAHEVARERGLLGPDPDLDVLVEGEGGKHERMAMAFRRVILGLRGYAQTLKAALAPERDPETDPQVRWIDLSRERAAIAPLYPGRRLRRSLYPQYDSVLLTSATLATRRRPSHGEDGFELFRRLTGFEGDCHLLPEVFDYRTQCRLRLYPYTPPTEGRRSREYLKQLSHAIERIVRQRGRHLVLLTSYTDLRAIRDELQGRLPEACLLLAQTGERSRQALLRAFTEADWAVLLGVASFWKGIDVPGMSSVTLVRLPFEVPRDPITESRLEDLERRGENSFIRYLLPQAVLTFKQGFGRLIRRRGDRGTVHVLDGRVLEKPYGKSFLNALPPELPSERSDFGEAALDD